ncbi:helix-turn-helix domain-containing protein [Primorskyibacter aestuariivivens]|uniref:helix-turn-helix domain-containing protein n=1 Tax=Primorskyibacter aestuariivivens TaxID=1888912 RepID=UPI0023014A23|nr:helix-turn-helix domain-containing protein [Primorskyibacter aestuariivivens]MDA7429571.1 helix-turn-helix domain-containing protein [Primorskyibacter aestuariivivens]
MKSDQTQIDTHVGARLRDIRRAKGVSKRTLAISAGIKQHQIEQYEIGSTPVPSAVLWRFSAVFDVAPAEFYRGFSKKARRGPYRGDRPATSTPSHVKDTE